ncbi:MAG: hypothetical protein JSV66_17025 [Trueperaceae bacterium]|nr:MAG: hypothetical protein JSV66_17025 [Trueperaceae bacterium]
MEPKFKLISSSSIDLFEERLSRFIESMGTDDVIIDIKFSTAPYSSTGIEYSALVHYQSPVQWG